MQGHFYKKFIKSDLAVSRRTNWRARAGGAPEWPPRFLATPSTPQEPARHPRSSVRLETSRSTRWAGGTANGPADTPAPSPMGPSALLVTLVVALLGLRPAAASEFHSRESERPERATEFSGRATCDHTFPQHTNTPLFHSLRPATDKFLFFDRSVRVFPSDPHCPTGVRQGQGGCGEAWVEPQVRLPVVLARLAARVSAGHLWRHWLGQGELFTLFDHCAPGLNAGGVMIYIWWHKCFSGSTQVTRRVIWVDELDVCFLVTSKLTKLFF